LDHFATTCSLTSLGLKSFNGIYKVAVAVQRQRVIYIRKTADLPHQL
jgi:hypothetical protein